MRQTIDLFRNQGPLVVFTVLWPHLCLYDKQIEIIKSVRQNAETFVRAGNMLGKDFVAGFICLYEFLRNPEARIVTTSVKDDHLRVLWGEIERFIDSSVIPLTFDKGGPLIIKHRDIRKLTLDGVECSVSYLRGMVSERGEGMAGHHATYTLGVVDEASGVDHYVYTQMDTWADRKLIFGNPNPCPRTHFFHDASLQGDIIDRDKPSVYERKVFRVRAEDSPNVIAKQEIFPGILPYRLYRRRRRKWDPIRQCIGLDAEFYEGAENLLFPPDWLNHSEALYEQLRESSLNTPEAMGVDSGEGVANTSWTIVGRYGIVDRIRSEQTPNTAVITGKTKSLLDSYGIKPQKCCFDRGGGGKEHADKLREEGYPVRSVSFGEMIAREPKRARSTTHSRYAIYEERLVYKNRRAQMYGMARILINPENVRDNGIGGFAISSRETRLRHQLSCMPLLYDGEGKMYMLPKNNPNPDSDRPTLTSLIGYSPDEADSFVLAVYAMLSEEEQPSAGAVM